MEDVPAQALESTSIQGSGVASIRTCSSPAAAPAGQAHLREGQLRRELEASQSGVLDGEGAVGGDAHGGPLQRRALLAQLLHLEHAVQARCPGPLGQEHASADGLGLLRPQRALEQLAQPRAWQLDAHLGDAAVALEGGPQRGLCVGEDRVRGRLARADHVVALDETPALADAVGVHAGARAGEARGGDADAQQAAGLELERGFVAAVAQRTHGATSAAPPGVVGGAPLDRVGDRASNRRGRVAHGRRACAGRRARTWPPAPTSIQAPP